jgi:hypothetical protein
MSWEEHTRCSSHPLPNFTKATELMGEIERKIEGNSQRTPRSRSNMFPSVRNDIDSWKCSYRSSLSFISRSYKNHRRNQELGKALRERNALWATL